MVTINHGTFWYRLFPEIWKLTLYNFKEMGKVWAGGMKRNDGDGMGR